MFSPVFAVDGKRRKKYSLHGRWLKSGHRECGVQRKMFPSLGCEGVRGHEVGVEVDNCQESGSVRVQGHSRATPTSICVLSTVSESTPSSYSNILHFSALYCAVIHILICSAMHWLLALLCIALRD